MSDSVISVVIPTQNMSAHLAQLLQGLVSSGIAPLLKEVIVVNDGSKDDTATVLKNLSGDAVWTDRLRVVTNDSAKGRFEARKRGALTACSELVLFLDSRVRPLPGTGQSMARLLKEHSFLMGMICIDSSKSVFNLYWERSHQWIFRRHYQDVKKGFYLTNENYEQYAKGTGVLLLSRDIFLKACEALGSAKIAADDTLLIREVLKSQPLFVTEAFSFEWEPRQTWKDFSWRLFDRGPGFVQYHFLTQRTRFFYASIFSVLFAMTVLFMSWWLCSSFLQGFFALIVLASLSVLLITKKPKEVFKIIPLHLLVIASFSTGVIYGLIYWLLNRGSHSSPGKQEII